MIRAFIDPLVILDFHVGACNIYAAMFLCNANEVGVALIRCGWLGIGSAARNQPCTPLSIILAGFALPFLIVVVNYPRI